MDCYLSSLDTLLRGLTLGALGTLALRLLGGEAGHSARLSGVAFCLAMILDSILSDPVSRALPASIRSVFLAMSFSLVGLLWQFVLVTFEDRHLSLLTDLPAAALGAIGLGSVAFSDPTGAILSPAHSVGEIGLSTHALYRILRTWSGDLVFTRRSARGPFLVIVLGYVLILSGLDLVMPPSGMIWLNHARIAILAVLSVSAALIFLDVRRELFDAVKPPRASPSEDERSLLQKLDLLIDRDQVWRREGLTIGDLALELGAPEHRVRKLINEHLGRRNFSAFINSHRIDAAIVLLADPANRRRPISAIAYELGFGSLGPFNRAFKAATGITPRQFRQSKFNAESSNT